MILKEPQQGSQNSTIVFSQGNSQMQNSIVIKDSQGNSVQTLHPAQAVQKHTGQVIRVAADSGLSVDRYSLFF